MEEKLMLNLKFLKKLTLSIGLLSFCGNTLSMELVEQKAKRVKLESLKLTDLPLEIIYNIIKFCFENCKDEQELMHTVLSLPLVSKLFSQLSRDKQILFGAFKKLEEIKKAFYLEKLNLKYDPTFQNCITSIEKQHLLFKLKDFAKSKYNNVAEVHKVRNIMLLESADKGNLDLIVLSLCNGANINCKDDDGWTPLTRAAFNRHTEIVELLLNKGADINTKDYDGCTALTYAEFYGHKEVVELLKKAQKNLK